MGARRARSTLRVVAALAALLPACAAGAGKSSNGRPTPAPSASAGAAAAAASTAYAPLAEPEVPTLDSLAARLTRLAPGMHELARGEATGEHPLPVAAHDGCLRAAFAASRPVKGKLVGKDEGALADVEATRDGVLGARGPLCVRAGSQPRLVLEGDAGTARYVVWGTF